MPVWEGKVVFGGNMDFDVEDIFSRFGDVLEVVLVKMSLEAGEEVVLVDVENGT